MGYPFENMFGRCLFLDFNKTSYILENETFGEFQKNGTKKVKI